MNRPSAYTSPVTPSTPVAPASPAQAAANRARLIAALATLLDAVAAHTDPSIPLLPPPAAPLSPSLDPASPRAAFYSTSKTQPFSLHFYLSYLADVIPCSDAAFVCALVYLVRVGRADPLLRVSSWSVHRTFLTALLLACKFVDDAVCTNADFALAGGLEGAREMNKLEAVFLDHLGFALAVDPETYERFAAVIDQAASHTDCDAVASDLSDEESTLVELKQLHVADTDESSVRFDLYSSRGVWC